MGRDFLYTKSVIVSDNSDVGVISGAIKDRSIGMVMGKIQFKPKRSVFAVIAAIILLAGTVSVVYVKSTSLPSNLHQGFVLNSGEIPPQYIPEKFDSRVLSWLTEQRIRSKYGITILYDVPGATTDDYYAQSAYSYANTMALFFAYEQGLQLEAGEKLHFEFVMADCEADKACVGYARDQKTTEPVECQYAAEGEQYLYNGDIEIKESGVYFPYIVNLSDETAVVQNLKICVVSD